LSAHYSLQVAVLLLTLLPAAAHATVLPPVWHNNNASGLILINNQDEAVATGTLPFALPFGGLTYTTFEASSNGFISLGGSNGEGCCAGNSPQFLSGFARIAPGWADLETTVYQNNMPGVTSLTWEGTPFAATGSILFQALLYDTGQIVFSYHSFEAADGPQDDTLIGVTTGNNVPDPGQSDILNNLNFQLSSNGAIYQIFYPEGGGQPVGLAPQSVPATWSFNGRSLTISPAAEVPEPASWVLCGLGLGALPCRRRRLG
jgi:hypothetical protein